MLTEGELLKLLGAHTTVLAKIEKELVTSVSLWRKAADSLDKRKGVEAGLLGRLERIKKVVDDLQKEHEARVEQTMDSVKEKARQQQ